MKLKTLCATVLILAGCGTFKPPFSSLTEPEKPAEQYVWWQNKESELPYRIPEFQIPGFEPISERITLKPYLSINPRNTNLFRWSNPDTLESLYSSSTLEASYPFDTFLND